jgi:hypothetical protein
VYPPNHLKAPKWAVGQTRPNSNQHHCVCVKVSIHTPARAQNALLQVRGGRHSGQHLEQRALHPPQDGARRGQIVRLRALDDPAEAWCACMRVSPPHRTPPAFYACHRPCDCSVGHKPCTSRPLPHVSVHCVCIHITSSPAIPWRPLAPSLWLLQVYCGALTRLEAEFRVTRQVERAVRHELRL